MICPCQMQQRAPLEYAQCCEPFHLGQAASTPLQLMRSRFSGFVLGLNGYIENTWHTNTKPDDLSLEADDNWLKLDIVSVLKNQVHFRAYFKDGVDVYVLDEISDFIFEEDHWLYVSGVTTTKKVELNRNDTCLCGSGKKYKKCCLAKQ